MKSFAVLGCVALALVSAGAAQASSFGPATGATALLDSPTFTYGALSGVEHFDSGAAIFSTTGSLTAAAGPGSASGSLDFSYVAGGVFAESIPVFLTFADTTGGSFLFSVSSVQTLSYSTSPASSNLTLYVLGMGSDANLGLTPAPVAVTITSNQTGGSVYAASATIANPPVTSAAPEPSIWALMIAGVGVIGVALRQSERRRRFAVG